jgi:hypothetical protein
MQISDQLLQNIVNYITTKPFNEVAPLINAINNEVQPQLKPVEKPIDVGDDNSNT